jgi:hypothetical protein
MGALPTVRIKNPAKPDDFMVINESDFDPKVHEKFVGEPKPSPTPKPEDKPKPNAGDGFPEGYRYENAKGGYGHLYFGDEIIEGPSNGKWQGEEAARAAAIDHAKHAAGE